MKTSKLLIVIALCMPSAALAGSCLATGRITTANSGALTTAAKSFQLYAEVDNLRADSPAIYPENSCTFSSYFEIFTLGTNDFGWRTVGTPYIEFGYRVDGYFSLLTFNYDFSLDGQNVFTPIEVGSNKYRFPIEYGGDGVRFEHSISISMPALPFQHGAGGVVYFDFRVFGMGEYDYPEDYGPGATGQMLIPLRFSFGVPRDYVDPEDGGGGEATVPEPSTALTLVPMAGFFLFKYSGRFRRSRNRAC